MKIFPLPGDIINYNFLTFFDIFCYYVNKVTKLSYPTYPPINPHFSTLKRAKWLEYGVCSVDNTVDKL